MRVLMFGWEFPPAISGGLGVVCHALVKELAAMGTHVAFVAPRLAQGSLACAGLKLIGADQVDLRQTTQKIFKELSLETVELLEQEILLNPYINEAEYSSVLTQIKNHRDIIKTALSHTMGGRLSFSGGYGRDLFQEVARYAVVGYSLGASRDFDVIHAHDWMTYPAAIEAKRASGKPLVCHVHATEFDRTGDNPNGSVCDIEWRGMDQADRVIAVSHRTKEMLVSRYKIDADKIKVVHNAVNKEKQIEQNQIKKAFSEKIVLFLGRVTLQKGPDYFVEAARLVLNRLKNVRFVMAGTGDMLNRLVERTAKLGMQRKFHFTGFLKGREVEEIFAMSDLYVMPSVSEPFGITSFEALLYHVPIIISHQSGAAEVLQHAPQVDFWDVQKMADTIVAILTDDALADRLVDEGYKELEDVSWARAARQVNNVYKELQV